MVRRITVKILLFYTLYYRYSSNLNDSCNLLAYCICFIYKYSDNNSKDNEDAVTIYSGDSSDGSENAAATDSDDNNKGNEGAAAIRANYPIPLQCKLFYFESDIIDEGKRLLDFTAKLNKILGQEDHKNMKILDQEDHEDMRIKDYEDYENMRILDQDDHKDMKIISQNIGNYYNI